MPVDNLMLLKSKTATHGQAHMLDNLNTDDANQVSELYKEVEAIDFDRLKSAYESTKTTVSADLEKLIQPPDISAVGSTASVLENKELRKLYEDLAFQSIKNGEFAVVLLAGGQGTRLGSSSPKGMYNIDLPSDSSLFELQAQRIRGLLKLVKSLYGCEAVIHWYIMTSSATRNTTEQYFKEKNFLGLNPKHVIFFNQSNLPALSFDGKILMESPISCFKAPDGNGGVYNALLDNGILTHMTNNGVRHVQFYCVDNVLIKIGDPLFLGYCIHTKADCAAKVVKKTNPVEPIGVIGTVDGQYRVIEYSEIGEELSSLRNADGDLQFRHGNICIHFMTLDFLNHVSKADIQSHIPHHVAKKKIPVWDGVSKKVATPSAPNGIKLEKFIFDVFPFASNFRIWEVPRNEEFSPLKNPDSAGKDCPSSCKTDLLALHRQMLTNAGAVFKNNDPNQAKAEISPLVSLFGENLETFKGLTLENEILIVPSDNDAKVPKISTEFRRS